MKTITITRTHIGDNLTVLDYDPYTYEVSWTRTLKLQVPDGWDLDTDHVGILHIVSHDPIPTHKDMIEVPDAIALGQLVTFGGIPWVDEFGFYVYVRAVPILKYRPDIDLRYGDEPNYEPEYFDDDIHDSEGRAFTTVHPGDTR